MKVFMKEIAQALFILLIICVLSIGSWIADTKLNKTKETMANNNNLTAGVTSETSILLNNEDIDIVENDVGIVTSSSEYDIEYEDLLAEDREFVCGYIKKDKVSIKEAPDSKSKTLIKYNTNDSVFWTKENDTWAAINYYDKKLDIVTLAYVEVKNISDKKIEIKEQSNEVPFSGSGKYSPSYLKKHGVINWGGYKWTYYSQRVLPGYGLKIPGRHVDSGTGLILDKNGYICLASGKLKKGTIVDTPFGCKGKVYDCGCAANVLDVYCNW